MTETPSPSRRTVLEATGGAFAAAAGAGGFAAAAPDDTVEVNVGFSPGGDLGAARDAATDVVHELPAIDVVTVHAPKRVATALERRADVDFVEANGRMRTLAQTLPWGVDRTDADVATANGFTGFGARVAIIDTGIDDDHRDAEHLLGSGKAVVDCGTGHSSGDCSPVPNGNACNEPWSDDHDHGTHSAGIAAAVDDSDGVVGVGPDVVLHAVKVFDCTGVGSFSDVAAGINHVAKQGWAVGSMGFGASPSSSTVSRAIINAKAAGVTLVAAAGDDGPCTDCVAYPARHPDVVAVSASNCVDDLATFSSQGPEVDLIAPGTYVRSTVPGGYATFSGTSMAVAHVAGAAGILAANGLSRSQIISTLKHDTENLGLTSNRQGGGLLDVAATLGLSSGDDGFGNSGNC